MEGLASRGNIVYVIMNTYLEYAPLFFKRIDITVLYRRRKLPPASHLFKKQVKKNISKIEQLMWDAAPVDWVHIHGDMHLPAAIFLRRCLKTKLFFAFRANDIRRARIIRQTSELTVKEYCQSLLYNAVNRLRELQVSKEANLVTFQNNADRDDFIFRTGFAKAKTIAIPGNIGLPRCTPEWKDRNNSTVVRKLLYVGVISFTKGLQYLLEALAILKKKGYDSLQLFVLGKTDAASTVFDLVKSLDIENMVFFEGYTFPFPYLASCDLLVYPTLYDAFPDTILEALHAACPVIASAAGGIPDMLCYEDLLFPPGKAASIASHIQQLIDSPGYYRSIRDLCAKRAREYQFDWVERFENAMTFTTV
jgi:glycosyltransferase involved in cell wall biosynthesis